MSFVAIRLNADIRLRILFVVLEHCVHLQYNSLLSFGCHVPWFQSPSSQTQTGSRRLSCSVFICNCPAASSDVYLKCDINVMYYLHVLSSFRDNYAQSLLLFLHIFYSTFLYFCYAGSTFILSSRCLLCFLFFL